MLTSHKSARSLTPIETISEMERFDACRSPTTRSSPIPPTQTTTPTKNMTPVKTITGTTSPPGGNNVVQVKVVNKMEEIDADEDTYLNDAFFDGDDNNDIQKDGMDICNDSSQWVVSDFVDDDKNDGVAREHSLSKTKDNAGENGRHSERLNSRLSGEMKETTEENLNNSKTRNETYKERMNVAEYDSAVTVEKSEIIDFGVTSYNDKNDFDDSSETLEHVPHVWSSSSHDYEKSNIIKDNGNNDKHISTDTQSGGNKATSIQDREENDQGFNRVITSSDTIRPNQSKNSWDREDSVESSYFASFKNTELSSGGRSHDVVDRDKQDATPKEDVFVDNQSGTVDDSNDHPISLHVGGKTNSARGKNENADDPDVFGEGINDMTIDRDVDDRGLDPDMSYASVSLKNIPGVNQSIDDHVIELSKQTIYNDNEEDPNYYDVPCKTVDEIHEPLLQDKIAGDPITSNVNHSDRGGTQNVHEHHPGMGDPLSQSEIMTSSLDKTTKSYQQTVDGDSIPCDNDDNSESENEGDENDVMGTFETFDSRSLSEPDEQSILRVFISNNIDDQTDVCLSSDNDNADDTSPKPIDKRQKAKRQRSKCSKRGGPKVRTKKQSQSPYTNTMASFHFGTDAGAIERLQNGPYAEVFHREVTKSPKKIKSPNGKIRKSKISDGTKSHSARSERKDVTSGRSSSKTKPKDVGMFLMKKGTIQGTELNTPDEAVVTPVVLSHRGNILDNSNRYPSSYADEGPMGDDNVRKETNTNDIDSIQAEENDVKSNREINRKKVETNKINCTKINNSSNENNTLIINVNDNSNTVTPSHNNSNGNNSGTVQNELPSSEVVSVIIEAPSPQPSTPQPSTPQQSTPPPSQPPSQTTSPPSQPLPSSLPTEVAAPSSQSITESQPRHQPNGEQVPSIKIIHENNTDETTKSNEANSESKGEISSKQIEPDSNVKTVSEVKDVKTKPATDKDIKQSNRNWSAKKKIIISSPKTTAKMAAKSKQQATKKTKTSTKHKGSGSHQDIKGDDNNKLPDVTIVTNGPTNQLDASEPATITVIDETSEFDEKSTKKTGHVNLNNVKNKIRSSIKRHTSNSSVASMQLHASSRPSSPDDKALNSSMSQHGGRPAYKTQSMSSLQVPGHLSTSNPWDATKEEDTLSIGSRRPSVDSVSRKSVDYRIRNTTMVIQPHTEEKPKSVFTSDETYIQSAVPCLPMSLAVVCLILNIVIPGSGTAISGLSALCCGHSRSSNKEDQTLNMLCANLFVAIAQLFTVSFLLVGWFWSISWGIKMVSVSARHREEIKQRREKDLQALALSAFGSPKRVNLFGM